MLRHHSENIYPNLRGVFLTEDDKERKERQEKRRKGDGGGGRARVKSPIKRQRGVKRGNETSIMADDEQMTRYNVLVTREFNLSVRKLAVKFRGRRHWEFNAYLAAVCTCNLLLYDSHTL
ncbi:PREDICTED: uncharacterized protein LOC108549425 [Eufriesea mexicana]|uniref:uncharacterized protein LOC108549425 n=1 Tax=Eufriesea mexicana TaxID=516756 RepID=UPI00083C5EE5|nr:PREDICTED: uncharacterized protein LOC108549425 [Eufriesea mexicana]